MQWLALVLHSSSLIVSRQDVTLFAGLDADHPVVWLRGEHDASTEAALSETMARAIALDDPDLVIDLSDVQFMGASTVSVIVRTRELLRERSRSLTLRCPMACARRILELYGLTDLLDPRPVHDVLPTEHAFALGTWRAVPTTDRVDRRDDVSMSKPFRTPDTDRDAVACDASTFETLPADEPTASVAGRGRS